MKQVVDSVTFFSIDNNESFVELVGDFIIGVVSILSSSRKINNDDSFKLDFGYKLSTIVICNESISPQGSKQIVSHPSAKNQKSMFMYRTFYYFLSLLQELYILCCHCFIGKFKYYF